VVASGSLRIDADVLIPGRGAPLARATVLVESGVIRYAGPRDGAPTTSPSVSYEVPVVMPGMWDCHCHLVGVRTLDLTRMVAEPVALLAARATADAQRALECGFTSLREAGGLGVHLARAIGEGSIAGPNIYAPGAVLSVTGGHGDLHCYPTEWVDDYSARVGMLRLCDGVPECLRAVRQQLRLGARVIKVCASGGVLSEVDDPIHQQFSDEELRAIVDEAARAGRIVMAHCHGKPGILAALRAGVHTIEHGSYLDEECATLMREAGAVLVPTRLIIEGFVSTGEASNLPTYALAKVRLLADQHLAALRLAIDSGVRIALGTDIAFSDTNLPAHWGQNAEELSHLVKAGMTPLEAIEAATAHGPSTLGPQAPRSGQLIEGYDADLIALSATCADDVSVLMDPANITHVWKGGRLVKQP
jgi:imidazolonepropionase-like amidohydrolase